VQASRPQISIADPGSRRRVLRLQRVSRTTRPSGGIHSAGAAKRSKILPRRQPGLLRSARNDGARGIVGILQFSVQRQARLPVLAAHLARVLPGHSTLSKPRGRREGRVLTSHPRSAARKVAQKDRTAAYRWRQSLGLPCAMVGRLMPCSPGSRTFPLASLTPRIDDAVCPVGLAHIFAKGLTVATTARTTRFCRTHGPPCRRSFPELRRQNRKLTDETKPGSAARPHAVSSSQGLPALPAPFRADAAASTASPARENDDLTIAPQG
jgi:hypothetical protein